MQDDVLSLFTLTFVIQKLRLILSWRNNCVNSSNFNIFYVFLIDEINPVVAKFFVEMDFSSGSILDMFTNVKDSQGIGNFKDIKLFL